MMKWGAYLTTAYRPDQTQRQVFEEANAYVVAAEKMGYDVIWLLEHHFTRYGLLGSPVTMAAYILGKTQRIKVGTAVTVVGLDHPVRLAENVALVDQLTQGRMLFGMGRGYFLKDFEVFGRDVRKNHLILDAWTDIMLQAWTTGKCSADNEFVKFPEISVFPEPFTKPHPPLYVAASSPSRTEWAAARGIPMLLDYLVEDEHLLSQIELYNEVARSHGRDPSNADHMLSSIAYVGDPSNDDRVRKYVVWWEDEFLRASKLFSPENKDIENYAYYHRQREAAIIRGDWKPEHRVERLLRMSPMGLPDQCIERLQRTVEVTGVKHITLGFECVGEHNLIIESMHRFMEEVAPHIKPKKG